MRTAAVRPVLVKHAHKGVTVPVTYFRREQEAEASVMATIEEDLARQGAVKHFDV
jgi:hypothetical protein